MIWDDANFDNVKVISDPLLCLKILVDNPVSDNIILSKPHEVPLELPAAGWEAWEASLDLSRADDKGCLSLNISPYEESDFGDFGNVLDAIVNVDNSVGYFPVGIVSISGLSVVGTLVYLPVLLLPL